ncbi:MAG: serine/threonine protein kinase [Gemmatimonadaceae bacterium]|nr:serine/threonine protein kinase [Gemmatimonadaceae bacterium]MCC6242868.1 serine/threonine protein kinase [Gemmatimonadaceae bacterium]
MTEARWAAEKALFLDALDQPTDSRLAWVHTQCGDDVLLCEAVLALLRAHDVNDTFLETPAAALSADVLSDVATAPARIGAYRLQRELGRGGMGTVWLAARDDGEFAQQVAIKLIKRGMDTDAIVSRFRHERQILAGLDHPNIARLLDGGTTDDGLPYFVLEYVDGLTVREFAASRALSVANVLVLFRTICAAVEHAHRNLVVHRDLKPGNILVTSDGVPKLLDFGIAKLLDTAPTAANTTSATLAAFTPEYASPEQRSGVAVTTATDVYSLGVVLYELLAGARPNGQTPVPPSDAARVRDPQRAQQLRGDLDTIVLMATHVDATRRYQSVAQLAEDIERYQQGLAVRAHRDSFGYRAAKFIRRHRASLAAAVLVVVSLVGGLGASLWQARRAETQRERAERRFAEVRSLATGFLFDVHDAIRNLPGSTPARALLIQRGLASLDGLAREAQGDATLQRDLALAYQRIGEVQGNSYGANLGDSKGALASYRHALSLLESLGAAQSSDPELRRVLAESYRGMASMLNVTGDPEGAVRTLDRAVAVARSLATPDSAARPMRQLLANVLQELGDARGGVGIANIGDTKGALAAYREALGLREALRRERPADLEARTGLANVRLMLGSLAWSLRDTSGAASIREGVSLLEGVVADAPDDAVHRNELLAGYGRLRVPLVDAGRYADAIAIDRKVVATMVSMVEADPRNTLLQRNLSVSYNSLARDLRVQGDPAQAVVHHRQALAIAERLRTTDPASIEHQQDVAFTEDVLAEALSDAGAWPDALRMYARAIADKQALRRAEPANPWHADDLAFLYAGLGAARVATSALDSAAAAYQQAVPLAEAAVTRQEGNPKARATLAAIYGGLATMHRRRHEVASTEAARSAACREATAWLDRAERHWRELAGGQQLTASDKVTRQRITAAVGACVSR